MYFCKRVSIAEVLGRLPDDAFSRARSKRKSSLSSTRPEDQAPPRRLQAFADGPLVAARGGEHAGRRQARRQSLAVGVGEQRVLRLHLFERAALPGGQLVLEQREVVGRHAARGEFFAEAAFPSPAVKEGEGGGEQAARVCLASEGARS